VSVVVQFKSCPRCRGDLQTIVDMYGEYRQCLQCGYALNVNRVRSDSRWVPEPQKAGTGRRQGGKRNAA
jgi:hypothetical protein